MFSLLEAIVLIRLENSEVAATSMQQTGTAKVVSTNPRASSARFQTKSPCKTMQCFHHSFLGSRSRASCRKHQLQENALAPPPCLSPGQAAHEGNQQFGAFRTQIRTQALVEASAIGQVISQPKHSCRTGQHAELANTHRKERQKRDQNSLAREAEFAWRLG